MSNKKTTINLSDNQATAIAVGGLVLVGIIATAGIPVTLFSIGCWAAVGLGSVGVIAKKGK
jgi:hypothetical protein